MNSFKKLAVLALAVAALGLSTASVANANWAWKRGPLWKAMGDYGMNPATHRSYHYKGR